LTQFRYRFHPDEIGIRRNFQDNDYWRYVAGVNGDFNFKDNGFISRFGYDAGFVFGATVTDLCRTIHHRLFRLRATRALRLLTAQALGIDSVRKILDLLLDLNDIRMRVAVTQPQRVELRLEVRDTCSILAFARNSGGRLRFAGHLTLQRGPLDLCLSQFLHRGIYAFVEIVKSCSHLAFAGTHVQGR